MYCFKFVLSSLFVVLILSNLAVPEISFAAENDNAVKVQGRELKSIKKVNINQASEKELAKYLKGIGGSKARAIIKYREQHGGFKSIDELEKIKGIGKRTIEKNKENIVL